AIFSAAVGTALTVIFTAVMVGFAIKTGHIQPEKAARLISTGVETALYVAAGVAQILSSSFGIAGGVTTLGISKIQREQGAIESSMTFYQALNDWSNTLMQNLGKLMTQAMQGMEQSVRAWQTFTLP